MLYLLYGIIIGFAIGISVGPNAILCLRRSMSNGSFAGITTGIGAATAHVLFAAVAIFGLHFVEPFFAAYGDWIRLIGSLIILVIAIHIAKTPVIINHDENQEINHGSAFLSSLLVTLSGPLSIASYALFIGFMNLHIRTLLQSVRFLIGVFAGNLLWWIPLSIASSYFYLLFKSKYTRYIDVTTGILLGLLALFGIATSLFNILR